MDNIVIPSRPKLLTLLVSGTIIIGLLFVKLSRTEEIPVTEDIEEFKMPKFPSVNDITRPVIKPIKETANKTFKKLAAVEKSAKALEKKITKQLTKEIGKATDKIKSIEHKIIGGFSKIFDGIKQGISFILFFPQCFIWYALNIVSYIIYAPVAFFVWVFSLHSLEKTVFEYIEYIDKQMHRVTGVHPFHFSDVIQAKCYFSKTKMREISRKKADTPNTIDMDDHTIDDSELIGYIVLLLFIGIFILFGIKCIS